ncbi:hypothetical protein [Mycolicibacterium mucogenicum]|uniref:Uncharacterized protein n=1 Tax=Mycolicibacterium mucogenicum DSM 44124 TaxID=1226753 RepID=A0A8H2J8Y8_MYCMU|nr:hypothetical protein [Mycolicibacterium mucogenicum]KAB7761774.1 hypothetical protein MMUC44124_00995 [Mycolicibacterium mucogenicum DSM 44124]QPG70007.1 hypothetical protein C1S78_002975 [Mycolicibacterium mucogenicum DSM 44124]
MTDNSTGQAAPDEGAALPRALAQAAGLVAQGVDPNRIYVNAKTGDVVGVCGPGSPIVTANLLPEHRDHWWTDRVGNLWQWSHRLSEWLSGPRFGGYNPRHFGPFTRYAPEQRYVEVPDSPPSELVVFTDPDGWPTKGVEFTASDEGVDAKVTLTRGQVEGLHAQLGAWLESTR